MDSKVTCLTCHAVQLRMYGATEKMGNRNFLRGSEPVLLGFCFNCHQEKHFQKTNPINSVSTVRVDLPVFAVTRKIFIQD